MNIPASLIIAAGMLRGVGKVTLKKIIHMSTDEEFRDSVEGFCRFVDQKRLGKNSGIMGKQLEAIESVDSRQAEKIFSKARSALEISEEYDIHPVFYVEEKFPQRLLTAGDHPLFLFYRGDIEVLNKKRCAAVIGTRHPTRAGKEAADRISGYLARNDFTIVSGLAFGCDKAAHRAAIESIRKYGCGSTAAVLADGLDPASIYPSEHKELADEIVRCGGVLVSEYIVGTRCNARQLVARDSWQADLSEFVIPVQTDVKGGTMHAVTRACKRNTPVFMPYIEKDYDCVKEKSIDKCAVSELDMKKYYDGFKNIVENFDGQEIKRLKDLSAVLKQQACAPDILPRNAEPESENSQTDGQIEMF